MLVKHRSKTVFDCHADSTDGLIYMLFITVCFTLPKVI